MMERFFYEGCGNEELYESLKGDPVFALVRDLNFTYKLKVLQKVMTSFGGYKQRDAYLLVNHLGFAVCAVTTNNEGGKDGNKLEYVYNSPYYSKQRGESKADKQTIRSVKVSSLMATLKRQKVVPNNLGEHHANFVSSAKEELSRALGNQRKTHELNASEVHALLAYVLGENTSEGLLAIDLNKCKIELDKMNKADEAKRVRIREVNRVFTEGYYQAGIDEFGHLIVGKFKVKAFDSGNFSRPDIDCIEPFKRYVNPNDYAELIPLMTMTKLAYESASKDRTAHGIPIIDAYDESLDTVFYRRGYPSQYHFQWMFTPIGASA